MSKRSTQRREALLGQGCRNENVSTLHDLPTERSRDIRTADEIAQIIPWVRNVVAMLAVLTFLCL
jgi:hypothetical protein